MKRTFIAIASLLFAAGLVEHASAADRQRPSPAARAVPPRASAQEVLTAAERAAQLSRIAIRPGDDVEMRLKRLEDLTRAQNMMIEDLRARVASLEEQARARR